MSPILQPVRGLEDYFSTGVVAWPPSIEAWLLRWVTQESCRISGWGRAGRPLPLNLNEVVDVD